VRVRPATEADAGVLGRLWAASTDEGTFTPYAGASFEPALVREHVALVAEDRDEIVGTVYANVAHAEFGFVFGLYVHPDARGRGVGRTLMRAIAADLRTRGRHYIVLSVDTPNDRARRFYERLGFVDAARMLRVDVDRLLD
jgi:ribosomal-protein-alanine N-acetyltransferase